MVTLLLLIFACAPTTSELRHIVEEVHNAQIIERTRELRRASRSVKVVAR